jgi:hypothetical protein
LHPCREMGAIMLFKKLIWVSEIVGKRYHGREAIYNSVALPTIFLRQALARLVGGGPRNYKWLPYRALLLVPDDYPDQFFKLHNRAPSY